MSSTQCLPRESLKLYLAGWSDPDESAEIEAHLLDCNACEQTIVSLESDPDTLVDLVKNVERNSIRSPGEDVPRNEFRSLENEMELNEFRSTVGPYELLRPLGQGGMGAVYLATHQSLGKQVAIKLLPIRPFRNEHYAARFLREIRTAGKLNHASIVSATDAGEHNGIHFLVMEYIDGLDLSRIVRATGPLSISDACAAMRDVALGLSYAHSEGIVHRDIKPSNLILSNNGQVKILDFGLAQVSLWDEVSAELTTVGQLLGTLDYMAPEQAENPEAVDYRADLYSMGATLFRLLCGRPPLIAAPNLSPLAKLRQLAHHEPPSLHVLRPDAPEALTRLVDSLLARDPNQRPASAAHVAEQLEPLAADAGLGSLLASARESVEAEPDKENCKFDFVVKPQGTHVTSQAPSQLQLQPHSSADLPHAGPAAAAVSPNSERGNSSSHWKRWLMAASFLPFLLAGIWIILDTQKGQLVIESMDADVQVKLARDGKVYETLQIVPGANATKLYAGQYEVLIDAGSDRFELDQDRFEIKRGDVVIAKVQQKSGPSESPTHVQAASPQASVPVIYNEPTYDGKPLSVWLNQFAFEQSYQSVMDSLDAISSLVTPENSDQVARALLDRAPTLDFKANIIGVFFWALRNTQKDDQSYCETLIRELDQANTRWGQIIIRLGFRSSPGPKIPPDLTLLLVDWMDTHVFHSGAREDLLDVSCRYLVDRLNDAWIDVEHKTRLLNLLLNDQRLGYQFWLYQTFPLGAGNLRQGTTDFDWDPILVKTVEQMAIKAIINESTGDQELTRAIGLLSFLHEPQFDRTRMAKPENLDELKEAISRRLRKLMDSPDSLMLGIPIEHVQDSIHSNSHIEMAIRRQYMPSHLHPSILNGIHLEFSVSGPGTCIPALKFLDLIDRLGWTDEFTAPIEEIARFASPFSSSLMTKWPIKEIFRKHDSFRFSAKITLPERILLYAEHDGTAKRQTISAQEWAGHLLFERCFSMLSRETKAVLLREARSIFVEAWVDKKIAAYDSDLSGDISEEEGKEWLQIIRRADENNDGLLSRDELIKLYKENSFQQLEQK